LTQKVIEALNQLNQQALNDFSVTGTTAIPTGTGIDIQLPLFEGNLVMLKNNTVAVVVDNFEIISNGVSLIGSYRYSPEGLVIWIKEKEI
jgi:hypothetical protein